MKIDLKLKTYEQLQNEVMTLITNSYLKDKKIEQLQSNWNSLREWLKTERDYYFENYYYSDFNAYGSKLNDVLDKMNELEGKDKNE